MKAGIVPSANSNWEVKEINIPAPSENQVLIKIRASGMCYTDVHQTRGELPGDFPRTLGHEPVGEIVAVGPGVTTRKTGDRVGVPWVQHTCGRCEWCARSKPMFCEQAIGTGAQISGGHAEYMVAYADATMLLPDGLAVQVKGPDNQEVYLTLSPRFEHIWLEAKNVCSTMRPKNRLQSDFGANMPFACTLGRRATAELAVSALPWNNFAQCSAWSR